METLVVFSTELQSGLIFTSKASSFGLHIRWTNLCVFDQVSDRGGGVPLRKIDRLFTYTYSTAPRPSIDDSRAAPLVSENSEKAPLFLLNVFFRNLICTTLGQINLRYKQKVYPKQKGGKNNSPPKFIYLLMDDF